MKQLLVTLLLVVHISIFSQQKSSSTTEFTVTGNLNKELIFTLQDIKKYPSKSLEDLIITNHLGEPRGTAKNLKGVLLKDILKELQFNEKSPKKLSEFYFVFVAKDNYKVVYSWNEIFNSPTGDHLFIITEKDGLSFNEMEERILVVTTSDFKTGRRHIKGLSKILVERTR